MIKRMSMAVVGLLAALMLFLPTNAAFAAPMSDNWANNDYVGYGYETDGGYVMAVQRMLKETPWGYSAVDGYFGPNTYDGVVGFQNGENIQADGVVGQVTWEEFEDYRVYVGNNGGTGQFFHFVYDPWDTYPAVYYRDACYGWYIDRSTNNSGDYWKVYDGFQRRTYICP